MFPDMRAITTIFLFSILLALLAGTQIRAADNIFLGEPELVSISSEGEPGNGSSFFAYLSADGRYVAFESWSTNWADAVYANEWTDIFVHDRVTGQTEQITRSTGGGATDEDSFDPVLSADGRYVAFFSYATNLVPGDTNRDEWNRNGLDLFIYDRVMAVMRRVSVDANGGQIDGNSVGTLTPDGSIALIISNGSNVVPGDSNDAQRSAIYWSEWQSGHVERITHGIDGQFPDGQFVHVWGSHDGSRVVFSSDAGNLVPGDTNDELDIFLYERATGQVRRISEPADGSEPDGNSGQPQISSDGRFVVFRSHAGNLVPGDTNGVSDIFLYDVAAGSLRRISVAPGGVEANGQSKDPSLCDDGRFVSFSSEASNLVPGDDNGETDAFLLEVATGEISALSRRGDGVWGDGRSHRSFLAPRCSGVAFATEAGNLIAGDDNGERDIYWRTISLPPVLGARLDVPARTVPGATLPVTISLQNSGGRPLALTVTYPLPPGTTYVDGSAGGGFQVADGWLSWQGEIAANSSHELSFALSVPQTPISPYALPHLVQVQGTSDMTLRGSTIVNGLVLYLPQISFYQD